MTNDRLNGATKGSGEEEVPPPPEVTELATACVRFVASRYKVALDYTQHTLSVLDQYARDARAEIAQKPESLELVQTSTGAYLGEVIRNAFGGTWFAIGDYDGWRLDMTTVWMTFNPIGMAREALLLEGQDGWHAHLEVEPEARAEIEQRMNALGSVTEDEYFAPTTRFDMVELAVEALRAKMIAEGHADVRFSRDDYKR